MIVFVLVITILICLHVFVKTKYSHWSKKGVKGPAPLPFIGNFGKLMIQKQSLSQLAEDNYKQFPKEKVVGLYCGFTPALLLRDPEMINHVLTTDFNNFVNRGLKTANTGFSNNLLISEDDIWRTLRKKMSPAFTSAKLKQMVPLIQEKVNKFLKQVDLSTTTEENCDIKEFVTRYAMELITSCGFGLDLDFYSNEMKELIDIGKVAVTPSLIFRLLYAAEILLPGIQSVLPAIDPTAPTRAIFIKLVNYVIKERKKLQNKRHDVMEVMINLLEEDTYKDSKRITEIKVDVNFIASQIHVLYVTGYETSSSTLSYLLYELALREDYQETVYREICKVLEKYKGKLSYDAVNEMIYLRKVLNETLRRHTFVGWIIRKASRDCTLPGSNIKVKAGTIILISTSGLHNDKKYFHNPNEFNPENFSADNLCKIPQCAFIPFSAGPRNCIGSRFATVQIMMAAAAFLKKFKVSPCTDKKRQLKFDSISITLSPVDGVWIKVCKRN